MPVTTSHISKLVYIVSINDLPETELPDKPFVLQRSPTNLKEKIALPAPIILSFIPDI